MKIKETLLIIAIFWGTALYAFPEKPERHLTPGTLCTVEHEDFEEFRYAENLPYCERNVAESIKREVYEEYNIPEFCRKEYTIDHFMPLSIGGDNKKTNLWPEHKKVKETRPLLEWDVYLAISNGEIRQDEAIEIIYEAKMNPDILRRERELLEECLAVRP